MEEGEHWRRYLAGNERILWRGRPSQRLFIFRPVELLLVPFSAVWLLVVLWMASAGGFGADPISLVMILFVFVGIYFLIGRFFADRYIRRRTYYAITDKRALILGLSWGRKLRDLPIAEDLEVAFDDAPRGSVRLGRRSDRGLPFHGLGVWHGDDGSFTFREVDAPGDVYNLIDRVKRRQV
ncbi:MAG: hypothetical protein AAFP17_18040 [Pseudomonadota bacterium]